MKKQQTYTGHSGSIYAMTLSTDERFLFSAGDDGVVALWDLVQAEDRALALLKSSSGVYALHYLEKKNILLVGDSKGLVSFVDLAEKKLIKQIQIGKYAIFRFFDSGENSVAALAGGGLLCELDLQKMQLKDCKKWDSKNLRSAISVQNLNQIFIGTSSHKILALNPSLTELEREWHAHENSVFSLLWLPRSQLLVSGGRDAQLNIWDANNNFSHHKNIKAHLYSINDMALSPSEDYFVTASRDKSIKLWDAHSFELLKVLDAKRSGGHTHSVNKVLWLRSDNSVISCGDNGKIIKWQGEI